MWMMIFLVLPIIGLSYVLWHIWQLLPFANPWRWTAVAVALLFFLSMFLGFSGAIEKMPLNMATVAYETGNSMIFILLYLVSSSSCSTWAGSHILRRDRGSSAMVTRR